MVKPELLEAYKRTEFIVDLPNRQTIICHGQRNDVIEQILSEHAARTGTFITAHNPSSQRLSDRENRERHRLLITDVEKQGFAYLTGRGVGEDTVRLADRIVVLDRGGVVEEGPLEELLACNGRFARLYQLRVLPESEDALT